MQSRGTLTLTLSLLGRERGTFGGTVSGSPNRDPRRVRFSSPLPARSGERIKVRGVSDCILTAKVCTKFEKLPNASHASLIGHWFLARGLPVLDSTRLMGRWTRSQVDPNQRWPGKKQGAFKNLAGGARTALSARSQDFDRPPRGHGCPRSFLNAPGKTTQPNLGLTLD